MTHLVATSAQRLKMCERLEVFSIGLSGHEGVVRQATAWCRAEHQRVVDSAEQRDGVRARFTTAVTALAAVNDAVDARLLWIDELALKLAREKEDWMQEMVKSQSKLQTTKVGVAMDGLCGRSLTSLPRRLVVCSPRTTRWWPPWPRWKMALGRLLRSWTCGRRIRAIYSRPASSPLFRRLRSWATTLWWPSSRSCSLP